MQNDMFIIIEDVINNSDGNDEDFSFEGFFYKLTDECDCKCKVSKANKQDLDSCKYLARILDGYKNTCFIVLTNEQDSFAPLNYFKCMYGCAEIQYFNLITKIWETL